jgi:phage terminase large subunit
MDELDHYSLEEWEQANFSLRGVEGVKLMAAWNPVDENSWIKAEIDDVDWVDMPLTISGNPYSKMHESSFIRKSKDGSQLLIKTTFLDNKWMVGGKVGTAKYGFKDDNLIKVYAEMRLKNENFFNVNVLGEWGVKDKNKKFAWAFSKEKHVKDFVPALIKLYGVPYSPNHVVWLSFDFNVNPMTCSCIQHFDKVVLFFKCFKLENSNTHAMCEHIKSYFAPGTVFKITGDSSGANRNVIAEDNLHNYQVIQKKLNIPMQQMYVPTRNPDIESNQVLLNAILNTYEVWIQPGKDYCDPIIYDLTYVEMDENKRMKKDRSTDKKNADFLDTVRYFFNVEFPNYLRLA